MSFQREITFAEIDFASPEMDESLFIRNAVLRKPLHMTYEEGDIENEWDSYHLAAFQPDGQIVGVLVLKPLSSDVVKMRQVAVEQNQQNSGIGKSLVLFSESFSIKKGFKRIELHARLTAVPFYKQLYYQTSGNVFKEVGIDHYFMFKDL